MPEAGADLARATRRRLKKAVLLANGVGGSAVFIFGVLAPGSPDPGDVVRLAVVNAITFVVFMAIVFPIGFMKGLRAGAPLERWLEAERPATDTEQELALRFPVMMTKISVCIWVAGVFVFGALNATYSAPQAVSAAMIGILGGVTCCALLYLMIERAARPVIGRALAGKAPPRTRGPSVAARLTMVWTLVTGVPLVSIAAIVVADLAGVTIDTLATVAILGLAVGALAAGLMATRIVARAVGDPVRDVQEAMASVERGAFDTRVQVDDGSEIGRLQAGFNRMAGGLAERERLRDLFGRHVGRDVAEAALDGELGLGGEEREVAVLFVDLIGSTALASHHRPTEVVALLNRFFRVVVETVEENGGWVNKFEGDGALCVFGAPTGGDDPAGCALTTARELHERLVAELPELDAGIGVSAGRAVAGNVGAEERFEYTVIGDPVNEAARLCDLAKRRPERVLASQAALERAGGEDRLGWTLGDEVELRGRAEPTRLVVPAG